MTLVSIMMPAWKFPSFSKFSGFMRDNFDEANENIEYYEMTPVRRDQLHFAKNVAVKFKGSDFNLQNLESLIRENKQLQVQIQRTKETVQNLSVEYQKIFTHSHMIKELDTQKTVNRAKKTMQLDEDNKRLRVLLKTQLENSERLRLETQNTIDTLQEEFSQIVRELTSLQTKSINFQSQEEAVDDKRRSLPAFIDIKSLPNIPKADKPESSYEFENRKTQ